MDRSSKKPCFPQYSTGGGTAVAEIVGGWGLSSCKINPDCANIRRLKDIFSEMDKLKSTKQNLQVLYDPQNDPEFWPTPVSPPECRPSWMFAENRPLITFSSSINRIPIYSFRTVRDELKNPAPGREFYEQGTDKWYRSDPTRCCDQASCCPSTRCHDSPNP